MSCGCSAFDGRNEMDGLDLASEEKFDNLVTDGEDWIGLGDEGFDNFLTAQARNRRARRKELEKGGMSRKEARKQSLLDVPRQPIGQAVGEITGQAQAQTKTAYGDDNTADDNSNDKDEKEKKEEEEGMGMGAKVGIGLLVVAVLGVGGYFAYKKYKG
tara:strand:+ start:888 stop:1361 length:474 start_codon:yes stop_codon:yes gene_type:complete